ncbi:glycosyltransferase [Sphingomonas sp. PR090111-T3T-6A]|uniref:glycosyltransferase n=1 Tax=Sphingomonas sp. PR090111-T3T-6A TaxID=685778 RepID=UPI00037774FA|nr:glycosyltransferase [Sphingomonas sp. PR090111-T3T-6A]
MKAAFHLHLFYPDIALDLIDRVAALGRADIDLFATYSGQLDPEIDSALDRVPGAVERMEVPNAGWDIAPLFAILPQLRARGYDVICKLHTKKGSSGYAAEWRDMAYDGTIGSQALVADILAAFERDPSVALIGSRPLYKSVASHQFRNAELLSRLAPRIAAPAYPPADWGFFAGTMFWTRLPLLERLTMVVADFEKGAHAEGTDRDGTLAHALERLFGLAPIADGGSIGLVDEEGIEITPAPGKPSHEPIIRTLVNRAERSVAPLDTELVELIRAHNPLVDYIRTGRDEDALDPNPYFSSSFYNRTHADVFAAGMHPLHHYTHHGATEGRMTGPLFDGLHYRMTYPDVTGDPLRHFLEIGLAEKRLAIGISQPEYEATEDGPRRFYPVFDIEREQAFLHAIANLPPEQVERARDTLVSIVMPAYNREATIASAIASVLEQTHERFELIVVDDGSTDATCSVVAQFLADPRVKLVKAPHGGVSAARNAGLAEATGEIVAYLDSDNRWKAWFLDVMVRHLTATGQTAAYCGIALRDDLSHLTGYRGDDFDWEACLTQNYVDLNAFCHRRDVLDEVGVFDTKLRRMVDWDLILRITRGRDTGYAPFVGCDYFDGRADRERITVSEPAAFQKMVWTKNRQGLEIGSKAFAKALKLTFAIKIAAPEDERDAWGDFHFAQSLAEAIERLGHKARIDFRHQWSGHALADEDVAIVLRGLIPYTPRPGQIAFLWNISHPDQVGYEEYDRYTRIYCASASHAALLKHLVKPPVDVLLQATDPARFHPETPAGDAPDILFCGNSRGMDREIVRWAIDADREPTIYGDGWAGLVPDALVAAKNIDNKALGRLYAGSGVVLNDHWPSMRAFGLVSNRLFDVVASGGRVVSDPVPSIAPLFGDAVTQVADAREARRAIDSLLAAPADPETRRKLAETVAKEHSFDARAAKLVGDALRTLGLEGPEAPRTTPAPRKPLRVHIIAPHGPHGPQSSAFIRLIAPLTDESITGRIEVTLGSSADPVPPSDVCIVQRTAMPTVEAVDALIRQLGAMGATLVTEVDDTFTRIGPDHPEAAFYRPLNAALERAIAASAETWFSTAELAQAYRGIATNPHVRANMLDPRLWRDWRKPRPAPFTGERVRMLYMGTHTHGADFAMIRPALERLAEERPGSFGLTVIGVSPDIEPAPWMHRLSPPAEAIAYPRFVHWLRDQGPFDVGLAPLVDNDFNRGKSDIKLLDYAALGLAALASDGPAYGADPALPATRVADDGWHEALAHILDHRDAAREEAARLHEYLWRHRAVSEIAPALLARLERLVAA